MKNTKAIVKLKLTTDYIEEDGVLLVCDENNKVLAGLMLHVNVKTNLKHNTTKLVETCVGDYLPWEIELNRESFLKHWCKTYNISKNNLSKIIELTNEFDRIKSDVKLLDGMVHKGDISQLSEEVDELYILKSLSREIRILGNKLPYLHLLYDRYCSLDI